MPPTADLSLSTRELPGPTGSIMSLSQQNLHSSQKPFVTRSTNTLSSSTRTLPTPASMGQVYNTAPLSPAGYSVRSSDTILTSTSSLVSNLSVNFQRVSMDQVTVALLDACMNTHLLYEAHNFSSKDSQILVQLQDIKDEFTARQSDISARLEAAFVGKWVWAFHHALSRLNLGVNKMREAGAVSNAFTSNTARKQKVEKYFKSVQLAWQELMVNLSLALNGGGGSGTSIEDVIPMSTDPFQMCLLGDRHLFGYGVVKSYDLAFKYYSAAARHGSVEAQNMLGCMYEQGLGQPVDATAAFQYYKRAADSNLTDAINNLGRMYEKQQDYASASAHFLRAAKMGHVDAMVSLGFMLENARGCVKDLQKAEEWYTIAANRHYSRAQNCIGSLYYRRENSADDVEAVKFFRMASKQGNAHAMNNLGICFEEGRGTARDIEAAKREYQKSAELNHPSGANNLGYILLMDRDYREAFKWFTIASSLGSIDALYNIGAMWESGVLHPSKVRDATMAQFYYEEAARKGCSKAKARLSTME